MGDTELNGIWIPKEILLKNDLSDKEKITLSMILCLSTKYGYCFANNKYFSKLLGVTINRASKIISSLRAKGYINIKLIYNKDKHDIKGREITITEKTKKGIVNTNNKYSYFEQYPIILKDKNIIKKYNKKYRYKFDLENPYTESELEKLYDD